MGQGHPGRPNPPPTQAIGANCAAPHGSPGRDTARWRRRAEAEKLLAQVQETGEQENIDKFSKRLVKVTRQHNDECKKLLTLMGVPYIKAPCEAEASCTALVMAVVATATEDTDSLTFRAGILLRHLTPSDAKSTLPQRTACIRSPEVCSCSLTLWTAPQ
ncbi:flap endonuclease 1-like [Oncorhynchus masou masou]|uniref:flap endonuclease 1-like n=1 Tax=Oncorhynchus masou masou TaxID=90313 RepID=UPI003183F34C